MKTEKNINGDSEKYHLISLNGVHVYDIVVTEVEEGLNFAIFEAKSDNDCKYDAEQKQLPLLNILDDGDKIKIYTLSNEVDYAQAEYLSVLLRFTVLYGQEELYEELKYKVVNATENGLTLWKLQCYISVSFGSAKFQRKI